MTAHSAHTVRQVRVNPGIELGRVLLTLLGGAVVIVGAFLDWSRGVVGVKLTNRSLIEIDFATRTDIIKTAGAIAVLVGLLAVLSLADRTGWLTRLAGAAAVILFALFAIEVYRGTGQALQIGAWAQLAGGVVLVLGGLLGPHPDVVEAPAVTAKPLEEREVVKEKEDDGSVTERVVDERDGSERGAV